MNFDDTYNELIREVLVEKVAFMDIFTKYDPDHNAYFLQPDRYGNYANQLQNVKRKIDFENKYTTLTRDQNDTIKRVLSPVDFNKWEFSKYTNSAFKQKIMNHPSLKHLFHTVLRDNTNELYLNKRVFDVEICLLYDTIFKLGKRKDHPYITLNDLIHQRILDRNERNLRKASPDGHSEIYPTPKLHNQIMNTFKQYNINEVIYWPIAKEKDVTSILPTPTASVKEFGRYQLDQLKGWADSVKQNIKDAPSQFLNKFADASKRTTG